MIKTHTFNLKHVGKIKIDKSNGELLEYYRCMCYFNEDPEIIKNIFKSIINEEEIIDFGNIRFYNVNKESILMFVERFYANEYIIDDVEDGDLDKIVIDIGANVGDSALFFASKGYKVIGFEPVPSIYELALKNVKLNPQLEKKINLVNKGLSDKKEVIKIKYNSLGDVAASSYLNESNYYCDIEAVTIKDILKEYNIENPFLLKMDCEGCENPVIFNSDLSMFEKIIFEYHTFFTGVKHEKLVSKLEKQGFKLTKKDEFEGYGLLHLDK